MRIAYITSNFGYDETTADQNVKGFRKSYTEIALKYGHTYEYVEALELRQRVASDKIELMYNGKLFSELYDCALVYHSNINSNVRNYMLNIYHILKTAKFPVINDSLVDHSKYQSFLFLNALGVPTVPTYYMSNISIYRKRIVEEVEAMGNYPFLLKPDDLFGGFGIVKIDSRCHLQSLLDLCSFSDAPYVIQPFLTEVQGTDVRCYVIEGEPFICEERSSPNSTSYLSNGTQGGRSKVVMPNGSLKEYAKKISTHIKSPYYCIDIFKGATDLVNEIELCGSFSGIDKEWNDKIIVAFINAVKKWFDKNAINNKT